MGKFITVIGNKQRNPHRGSIDGISPTITAACGAGGGMTPMLTDATIEEAKSNNFYLQMRRTMEEKKKFKLPKELEGKKFRIRKLTPTECFRLMGCDEETINTLINSGLSNSSLYRLAGNSIVIDTLYYILKKMFIDKEPDIEKNQQLTLF